MKKDFGLFCVFGLLVMFSSNANAQAIPPPGAGDKNLADRGVKDRSIELERVSREAKKRAPSNKEDQERQFTEIKEDFEQIQHSQSGIVDAYTKAKTIEYRKIAENAEKMNSGGKRLMGNLFPPAEAKKGSKKVDKAETKTESPVPADIKTLIVDLDNSVAAFAGNPMFTNPQVVKTDDNLKARADLEKILKLSSALKIEADKLVKQ